MPERETLDWEAGQREIADLGDFRSKFEELHELTVGPDGERFAAPGLVEEEVFGVCVNGDLWDGEFEKAWHLKFSPDGRLTALLRIDDEWTVGVDGEPWEQAWEFAWETKFSDDGSVIAVLIKDSMEYSVAVNGEAWEQTFDAIREYDLSRDGKKVVAAVQVNPLPEGEILEFLKGAWTVAVDGETWDRKFLNAYAPRFSADGAHVAAQIRTGNTSYTLAQDGQPWAEEYSCVWESIFGPKGSLLAPVRIGSDWTLAENGKPLWKGRYMQLWHQQLSPDGKRVAAVVAPSFGKWTIAVDDKPWKTLFDNAVLAPSFSSDGQRIAALARTNERWSIVVDDKVWPETFDMVWDPVFSPDGSVVLAKVERDGKYGIAADGRLWKTTFDQLWDPIFSPDGDKVLLRGIQGDTCFRHVVPLQEIRS